MRERILRQKKLIHENKNQFHAVFGTNLSEFFDFTGFDIVKFDAFLETPKGMSMRDFIKDRHGNDAVALIEKLISETK